MSGRELSPDEVAVLDDVLKRFRAEIAALGYKIVPIRLMGEEGAIISPIGGKVVSKLEADYVANLASDILLTIPRGYRYWDHENSA